MNPKPDPAAQTQLRAEGHSQAKGHAEPGEGHDEAEIGAAAAASQDRASSETEECHAPATQAAFPTWRTVHIGSEHAGRRLDVYLAARFAGWSRTEVAKAVQDGLVKSHTGRTLKPSSRLRAHEELHVFIPGLAPDAPPPPLPPVLFEDDRLLVFDKPPGLLVHPSGKTFVYALIGLARAARPGVRLDLVHRLDRETSGVILLTKDLPANRALKAALQTGQVGKEYLALVHGQPEWDTHDLHAPIGSSEASEIRLRQGVRSDGLPAHTTFDLRSRMHAHALLSCRLHTGRTHQIRVHLEHLGHPILGDKLYGQPDATFLEQLDHGSTATVRAATGFPRQALHAWRTELPHPDGHRLVVEAPLPADMQAIVDGATPTWADP